MRSGRVGSGHGEALIAGYGFASQATLRRLVWIAGRAAPDQTLVAVEVIYTGIRLYEGPVTGSRGSPH
ncbi:hypothetical protein [Pseudogemmobacter bohemicus]|uniref:hypothetical protein n=1 Tax=Pseudogemmobacter bohemicus TaxID=2250708 RepID=UPI000DD4EBBD|nr:hypothetical protein [Pseudogemmobacter bohemicus]